MNIEKCAEVFASFSGGKLFVGFSGGADSCAALLITAHFAERFGIDVTAVHINHHLRGEESAQEEKAAEAFARQRGIRFKCFHLSGLSEKNLEAQAREERLNIWKQLTAEHGGAVVLGHHRNDSMETLFLRLLRGGNVSALAALRKKRQINGVTVLRPLLDFSRQEIELFLQENGVTCFAMDSSNHDEKFLRNFLRNGILQKLFERHPQAFSGLSMSLDALADDADYLEKSAEEKFQQIQQTSETPLKFWQELHPAMQVRVLRLFLSAEMGMDVIPDGALLSRFRQEISRQTHEKRLIPITGGGSIALRGNGLWVEQQKNSPGEMQWHWQKESIAVYNNCRFECSTVTALPPKMNEYICCFDAEKIPDVFYLTPRRNGDKMIPFGRKEETSLKKLRTDRKRSADFDLPVLRDGNGVIYWAPGIRHSAKAPVTEMTRNIVLLKVRFC